MALEYLYLGRDNSIDLILNLEGSPVADDVMDEITRMTLSFNGLVVESTNQPGDPIRWRQVDYDTGEFRLFLQDENIPVGRYKVPVIVYFPDAPDGFTWQTERDDVLEIQAVKDQEGAACG